MSVLDFIFGGKNSLAQTLPSLIYGSKGINLKPQQATLDQLMNVANAQGDINHPLYQQLYGQQKGQAQRSLADSIMELTNQNRKLSAMGRTPLFSQERGGETLFRGLTRGYMDAEDTAADNARGILGSSAQTLGNVYGKQQELAALQDVNRYSKAKSQTGVAGILKGLFGLM